MEIWVVDVRRGDEYMKGFGGRRDERKECRGGAGLKTRLPLLSFHDITLPTPTFAFVVPHGDPNLSAISRGASEIFSLLRRSAPNHDGTTMLMSVLVWGENDGTFQIGIEDGADSQMNKLSQMFLTSVSDWYKANPTIDRTDPEAVLDLACNARKSLGDRLGDPKLDGVRLSRDNGSRSTAMFGGVSRRRRRMAGDSGKLDEPRFVDRQSVREWLFDACDTPQHPLLSISRPDLDSGDPSKVLVVTVYWSRADKKTKVEMAPPYGLPISTEVQRLHEVYVKELDKLRDSLPPFSNEPCLTQRIAMEGATRVLGQAEWQDFCIIVPYIASTGVQRILVEQHDGSLEAGSKDMRIPQLQSHPFSKSNELAPTDKIVLALTEQFTNMSAHFPEGAELFVIVAGLYWDKDSGFWSIMCGWDPTDNIKAFRTAYYDTITRLESSESTNLRDAGAVHTVAINARAELLKKPKWHYGYDINSLLRDPYKSAHLPGQPPPSSKKWQSSVGVNTAITDKTLQAALTPSAAEGYLDLSKYTVVALLLTSAPSWLGETSTLKRQVSRGSSTVGKGPRGPGVTVPGSWVRQGTIDRGHRSLGGLLMEIKNNKPKPKGVRGSVPDVFQAWEHGKDYLRWQVDETLSVQMLKAIERFQAEMEKQQSQSQNPSSRPHDPYLLLRAAKAAQLVLSNDSFCHESQVSVSACFSSALMPLRQET
ncbi:hypothetical protein TREMEDRAFT_61971 [Tremella mesenterica DSM 1558]|uniref:uncharacterized protein n=1 Tax=Tremella mesenterica (strain ATCC 24925 / CBS 8224 / DSM 1558 / NBRC 9311 / NRRL Y-6157 / RJB 2259-6 / UBC 559-6) TaxID=578456 RepID=UPI0003F48FE8|nr:uncharacterized protein TREMEDRAFT_61971 [Tremella mesenterica DSM 1558]EIW70212.1 hypothetical protein TREMEDRAFT_61971 [Tremella mesenterica DSM 1558]